MLVNHWSKAKITGLDSFLAMIQKAKHDYPNQDWFIVDTISYKHEIKK